MQFLCLYISLVIMAAKQVTKPTVVIRWSSKVRCGGLMVSALDSGASASGSSPGQGHCLTVPLSTQVCKWLPANLMLGVTLRWTTIPSRGSRNIPSRFMLRKPG